MANLISRTTGNWTAAGTWGLVDTTSLLISRVGTDVPPTSPGATARSSAFTPGAITIDGIAINLANRTGTTGTVKVVLWNNTGSAEVAATAVTVNITDLPAAVTTDNNGGWTVFAFASVLLLAATDYMVQITTSNTNQLLIYRDATANNWSRLLRTTTTQAPAAGDDMVVAGELTGAGTSNSYTVTMNSTAATDYGSGVADGSSITPALCVSCNGMLTFGTTAATNYILRLSGNMANALTGTINIGTVGTPMPRDSTAVVEFDCAADADFGWHNHGGTCNIQGLSRTSGKNVVFCLLNTDEAAAQTVWGVDTDTGWLSGDSIAIASTSRTASQAELRTLASDATSTTLTVTAGLTNAHSGTSPTQAEVINLTRNVKIRSVSSTAMSFMHNDSTAIVDIDWAEFSNMGNEAVLDWRGVTATTTTGSFKFQHCSLHDFEDQGLYLQGSNNMNHLTILDNVFWNVGQIGTQGHAFTLGIVTPTSPDVTISGNVVMWSGFLSGVTLATIAGITFTNNRIVSCPTNGALYSHMDGVYGTFSGNIYHSNANTGLVINKTGQSGTLTNYKIWRNGIAGFNWAATDNVLMDIGDVFGNGNANLTSGYASQEVGGVIRFRAYTLNGDTSFATTNGFIPATAAGGIAGITIFDNCEFSTVSGIKTAHTIDIAHTNLPCYTQVILRNTKLGAATPVGAQAQLRFNGYVASTKHNQVAGDHRMWLRYGILSTDTIIFNTASPSMRIAPTSATMKLESAPLYQGLKVAVNNGGTVTVSVYTRRSSAGDGAAYNGAQPRLIAKANPALGASFDSDVVLDTHSAADGTWEQLSGTTPAVTDNGVVECVVDCDGTVGWVNLDDWAVS